VTNSVHTQTQGASGPALPARAAEADVGCERYMAPERICRRPMDPHPTLADVWSLGMTLLELALGHYPFWVAESGVEPSARSAFEQLVAMQHADVPSLLQGAPLSPEGVTLIAACMVRDPESRPGFNQLLNLPWLLDWESMDVDVAAWLRGLGVVAEEEGGGPGGVP
jgi:mitogen-activated protein kinase kinase